MTPWQEGAGRPAPFLCGSRILDASAAKQPQVEAFAFGQHFVQHRVEVGGLDPAGKLFFFDGAWQPIASPTAGPMLDVAIGSDASLLALGGGHRLWTRIAPGDWAWIGAVNRYHVCGVTP